MSRSAGYTYKYAISSNPIVLPNSCLIIEDITLRYGSNVAREERKRVDRLCCFYVAVIKILMRLNTRTLIYFYSLNIEMEYVYTAH